MLTRGITAAVALALLHGGAAPRPYTVNDLGTLGGAQTVAAAMNDSGTVVGGSDTTTGWRHAFAWRAGTMTDLGTLAGGTRSQATGVNENGVVSGTAWRFTGEPRAVLWHRGRIADLGLPDSHGLAVNDNGQVLAVTTRGGVPRLVLWQHGQVTDLGPQDALRQTEGDLNNQGAVTMRLRDGGGAWQAGFQQVGWTRRAGGDTATDISEDNRVVGHRTDAYGRMRPAGPYGDLETLGGPDGAATVINERGEIAGYADTVTGTSRPTLWRTVGGIVDLSTRGVPATAVITDLNGPGQMIAADGYRALFIA